MGRFQKGMYDMISEISLNGGSSYGESLDDAIEL
jgi:hypothetical protein